ncbi:hypothetical protein CI15_07675 [Paraburkholderia monticola]|uniref:Uncharacterized protein n=1 Tax=Paraburkholderia monticola TaxID=1399968 RepID=A0A149PY93_9BURK|nr:hypothetical protein [Paraburkholderia monticola]KXU90040.1 hypothetical protein CI15_07675 [Paraburkholderia monticola]
MMLLKLFWRGELELPVAFWGGLVIVDWLIVDELGVTLIRFSESAFLIRFYIALIVIFNIFVLPGLWRSATYWQGAKHWAAAAKLLCIYAAGRVLYMFAEPWIA